MTPARETALARMKVDLQTISAATSPFTNTIRLVSRSKMLPSQWTSENLPGISLLDGGDNEPDAMSNNGRVLTMKVIVVGWYIIQPGGDTAATSGNSLYGDIVYAMTAPTYRTHNDTVIHTFDGAHEVLPPGEGDTIGMVVCNFTATYVNTWSAP